MRYDNEDGVHATTGGSGRIPRVVGFNFERTESKDAPIAVLLV